MRKSSPSIIVLFVQNPRGIIQKCGQNVVEYCKLFLALRKKRMEHLNGTTLRITTRYDNLYPYDVEVEGNSKNSSNPYILKGGFTIALFLELSNLLNFSYVLVPSIQAYDFARAEEIDLFTSSYSLNEKRGRIVDFTFQTGKSRVAAFLNHDFESSMKDTILEPFQFKLWLGIIGFIFVMSGAMMCISIFEKQNIYDTQFKSLSIILQRDSEFHFEKNASRFAKWIIGLASVIVMSTYTGNIVSIKSVNRYYVTSLESLLNSNYAINLEYGYNNGSIIQVIAESMQGKNPLIEKFLKKSAKSGFRFESFEKSIRDVDKKEVAYIIDEETSFSAVQSQLGNFPCNWGRILIGIEYPWVMYMRKKSPYKSALNSGLLKLQEVGLRDLLSKRWIPRFEACLLVNKEFIAVQPIELRFAYLILLIGFTFSIIVALIEKCIFHKVNPDLL